MPCWLLLLNDGGFPLFSRSYGLPSSAFSFPTMGLLSAVHSSAGASGFAVTHMYSQDARIRIRLHTGGLILAYATSDVHMDDEDIVARMGHIYDGLVLLIGKTKIQDLRNVERTKRQIRTAANLLSLFLVEDSYLLQMSTGVPECCIASNPLIFDHLRAISASCNTLHAAFYAQHRMYAWTNEWSQLDSRDLFTISCFLRSCTPSQARDVPVYLAHSSLGGGATNANTGKTPYRLLTISLKHELELVLLCGPNPTLVDAMDIVRRTITTPAAPASSKSSSSISTMHGDLLSACVDFPRHLPNSFSFHLGILGFLFLWQQPSAADASYRTQCRLVSSFLPTAPQLPTPAPDAKRRRSPSPMSRDSSGTEPPPSPSHFAPSNPLFGGSLLSESSVLSRSHALVGFYHLMREQLMPPPTTAPTPTDSATSAAVASCAPPSTSDAYMATPTRGFYACRRGAHSVYVMFDAKVSQLLHGPISWQLLERLEAHPHRL